MVTDTQSTIQAFEEAIPPGDCRVDSNPDAYPYTYFRSFGDSRRQAQDEVANGSGSVTLIGIWIDGTPGTITVGRDNATDTWRVTSRTPKGKGLAA